MYINKIWLRSYSMEPGRKENMIMEMESQAIEKQSWLLW